MPYVYSHIRLDTNEVFYIGIGNNSDKRYCRAYLIVRRNPFWRNVVNKTPYKVKVLYDDISWNEACLIEVRLIKKYGRRNLKSGSLVNLTNGGDGRVGVVVSEKTRLKISKTLKSKNIKTTAKLTAKQVVDICNKLKKNYSYQRIKKKYHILTRAMLSFIRAKRTWREITKNYNFPKPTREVSRETRGKISKTLMGKYYGEIFRVKCLNDNKIFPSVLMASKYYNISTDVLYNNINKKTKTIRGSDESLRFEIYK